MSRKPQNAFKVFLIEHDITRLKVDAIVNFELTGDLTGGMLRDPIHRAAGPRLAAECKEKVSEWLDTGEAVMTGAHGIPHVRRIIHAVRPVAALGFSASDHTALRKCHGNALRLACENELRKIAFACLYFEWSDETAIESTLNAVKVFLEQDASANELDAVIFCSRHDFETRVYRQVMTKCFPDMEFNPGAAKASNAYRLNVPWLSPVTAANTKLAGMCHVAPAENRHKSNVHSKKNWPDKAVSVDTVDDCVKTIAEKVNDEVKTIADKADFNANQLADHKLKLDAELVRGRQKAKGPDAGAHAFDSSAATPSEPSFEAPSVPALPPHRSRRRRNPSTKVKTGLGKLRDASTTKTGTETLTPRVAPDHEHATENSYVEVPPDASLARIVSESRAMQHVPYETSHQVDSVETSEASVNRIFKETNPWDSNYRQGEQIGQGAFGKVFEAWRREDEYRLHKVAIKHVMTQSKNDMQEARLMLQFRHPYLLGCYEVYMCNVGGTYNVFVVMDCMTYGSLDVILAEMRENQAFFSEQSARYILYCCTQALAFLHARNIIHRDVKSANILVSNEGRVKLGDFGLSGNLDEGAGMSVVGTLRYIAPEIGRKFVDYNSEAYTKEVDVFSLGVVGIELACGKPLHRGWRDEDVQNALCDKSFPDWLLYEMGETLTSREARWSSNYTEFVKNCLCYEARQRMKAVELLTLALFSGVYS